MRRVGAATFKMGAWSDALYPGAKPQHDVTLGSFCIDRVEVSVEAYSKCAACQPASRTNEWAKIRPIDHELLDAFCTARDPVASATHPITCVEWQLAADYCKAQSKRLPTEAEWELAASGARGGRYPWGAGAPTAKLVNACGDECIRWKKAHVTQLWSGFGDDLSILAQGAYVGDDGFAGTAPVDSFTSGASPYDVLHMAGNVREWVADFFGPYDAAAQTNPRGPESGEARVVRGGAWMTARAASLAVMARSGEPPQKKSYAIGFRCASDPTAR